MFRGYWPTLEELAQLREMGRNGGQLTPALRQQALRDDALASAAAARLLDDAA